MAFYREISHPLKKRNSGEEGRLHLSCVSNGDVDFSSITRVLQLGSGRPMAHFNTRIFVRLLRYQTFILVEQKSGAENRE